MRVVEAAQARAVAAGPAEPAEPAEQPVARRAWAEQPGALVPREDHRGQADRAGPPDRQALPERLARVAPFTVLRARRAKV
jgi:hypothetical protein